MSDLFWILLCWGFIIVWDIFVLLTIKITVKPVKKEKKNGKKKYDSKELDRQKQD